MATAPIVDVLILGGGPAGLACAGAITRQLHSAIIFGNNTFRNARAQHMHNVTGWDHADPAAFRARARTDLIERYAGAAGIQFRDVSVSSVRKLDDGERGGTRFEAVDVEGAKYLGRKVVRRGVGLWDNISFHCLSCHGFEERGPASAVAPVISRKASRLAGHVTIYTDGNKELGARIRAQLKSTQKFKIENRRLARVAKGPDVKGEAGVLVRLEDGSVNREGFLVRFSLFLIFMCKFTNTIMNEQAHAPVLEINGPFAADLGVTPTLQGHIDAQQPFYSTNVPGVYAAGDCATMIKAVPTATMMGACVGAGLAHALQAEDDVED
ncbi:FAD/NAD(P)-binding domain-containing protein [Daldinia vernicosa]|uniref:FAD/NAD(P)-binding domain-containing protein n=1 Tax=Daldinia vernicosa TaxID=114800 RepID=UPI002007B7B5|nr:FAD/NAD(P)-binding domain-containing protein [Daldinia vernicosa]KAI0848020.1 FAD/NAD(P)-binding domain-containing protein [Daldinia vernicosa]